MSSLLALKICHAALLCMVVIHVFTADLARATAVALAVVLSIPLVISIPGLRKGRRYTLQWLAIFMVLLIGANLAEAVAAQGSLIAGLNLAVASAELYLLLKLLRHPAARPPISDESGES